MSRLHALRHLTLLAGLLVCATPARSDAPGRFSAAAPTGPAVTAGITNCQPEDRVEAEPPCFDGYIDNFNGGCDGSPPQFEPLTLGESICGTTGTYIGANGQPTGDSDWFDLFVPSDVNLQLQLTAAAPTAVAVLQAGCPRSSMTLAGVESSDNATATTSVCLSPGNYFIVVQANRPDGIPCGSPWRLQTFPGPCVPGACCLPDGTCQDLIRPQCMGAGGTFTSGGAPCGSTPCCVLSVPPTAAPEGEPCNDQTPPNDTVNGGCNSNPVVFSTIEPDTPIAGQAWASNNWRDTDWYIFTLATPTTVTLTTTAEFPLLTGLFDFSAGDCAVLPQVAVQTAPPCQAAAISVELPPGTYVYVVTPDTFTGVQCGTSNDYVSELTVDVPPIACCLPDGTCITVTEGDCIAQGGLPQPVGITCETATCPQPAVGACCFSDGGCAQLSLNDCAAQGGEYRGDNTSCENEDCGPSPCPGDLDGSGLVGLGDLGILLGNWGMDVPRLTNGDLDGDGFVGLSDLGVLLSYWGCTFVPCECTCVAFLTGAQVCPGDTVTLLATLCNPSPCTCQYFWHVVQTGGAVQISAIVPSAGSVVLGPFQCIVIPIDVTIDPNSPRDIANLDFIANSCVASAVLDTRAGCALTLSDGQACKNETGFVDLTITNTGPCDDTFFWGVSKDPNSPQSLPNLPQNGSVGLAPGQSITIPVPVFVDPTSERGAAILRASASGPGNTECIAESVFTVPPPICDIEIIVPGDAKFCPVGCPDADDTVQVRITNAGECPETFDWTITQSGGDPSLTLTPASGQVTLDPGESILVDVTVDVAVDSDRGVATLEAMATGKDGSQCTTTADITIPPPECELTLVENGPLCPGTNPTLTLTITNIGQCEEDFAWSIQKTAGNPTINGFTPANGTETLCPGEQVQIVITLDIPQNTQRGDVTLKVTTEAAGQTACELEEDFEVPLVECRVTLRTGPGGSTTVCPGDIVPLQVVIDNDGDCNEAFNWAVVWPAAQVLNIAPAAGMVNVPANGQAIVNVVATIQDSTAPPFPVVPRTSFDVSATATEVNNQGMCDDDLGMRVRPYNIGAQVEVTRACPGDGPTPLDITFRNYGQCSERVTVNTITNAGTPGITLVTPGLPTSAVIPPGGSWTVPGVTYSVALGTATGFETVTVGAAVNGDTFSASGGVRIPQPDCDVRLGAPLQACPGDTVTVPVTLLNQGFCPESYTWNAVQVSGPTVNIAPAAGGPINMPGTSFAVFNLTITVPAGSPTGVVEFGINVSRIPPGGGAPVFSCGWVNTLTINSPPTCPACEVDLWIDSNNDQLIDPNDPPLEDTAPGRYIAINTDDDDGDGQADFSQVGQVVGEDDLVPILLTVPNQCPANPRWQLRFPGRVRAFRNPDRTGEVFSTLPIVGAVPNILWLEGGAVSMSPGDVSIALDVFDGLTLLDTDSVLATVIRIDLDADTNNDGNLDGPFDATDDADEETTPISLIVNDDDDDGDGLPDVDDMVINGPTDLADLGVLRVQPTATITNAEQLELRLVAPIGDMSMTPVEQRVRLFDQLAAGGSEIAGPNAGVTYVIPLTPPGGGGIDRTTLTLNGVDLGIEGVTAGENVIVEFALQNAAGMDLYVDRVAVRVAP